MVNKIIFDYLSRYGKQYSPGDLKRKILSKGYREEEIDEVMGMLGLEEKKIEGESASSFPLEKDSNFRRRGFKWVKLSGISGLLLSLIGFVLFVYLYLAFNQILQIFQISEFDIVKKSIVSVILFFMLLLIMFFMAGFSGVGRYANSGLVRFSSGFGIFLFFLFFALIIGRFYISRESFAEIISISLPIIFGLTLFDFLFFFIGLINIRKKVKFAGISGVLGIFVILGWFGLMGFIHYNYFSFFQFENIFSQSFNPYLVFSFFSLSLLSIFVALLVSLVSLKASGQFESFSVSPNRLKNS